MVGRTFRALASIFLIALLQTVFSLVSQAAQSDAASEQLLNAGQLEALVSPVALYPDTLLAEVLMASTYPLEVVEAERWVMANKNLSGDAIKAAIDKQSWDNSVKSLAATPSVLDMMSSKLDWTQQLGNAVLAQQADVMDAVQRLRTKAQANNKLPSTSQQKVSTEDQGGKQVIVIEPTQPDTVYVPYYNPAVVYGAWSYPAYAPYYFPPPVGYVAGAAVATGIAFGAGYALGRWTSGGYRWGGGCNWGGGNININRSVNIRNTNIGSNNWTHNPVHRQGVRYSNTNVAQKFGGNRNIGGGAQTRMDFRGRSGDQVLRPGGNLGSGGNLGGGNHNLGGGNRNLGGGDRLGGGNLGGGNRNIGGGDQLGAGNRTGSERTGGNAFGNIGSGRTANMESGRGRASLGGGGGRGGGGFRGGGRRSDIRLKHDIVLLGHLDNGLGFYRFIYNGGDRSYVGVMAQEVQATMPDAVTRGRDGYLLVFYDKLGLKFQSYDDWSAAGAHVPSGTPLAH